MITRCPAPVRVTPRWSPRHTDHQMHSCTHQHKHTHTHILYTTHTHTHTLTTLRGKYSFFEVSLTATHRVMVGGMDGSKGLPHSIKVKKQHLLQTNAHTLSNYTNAL